MLTSSLAGDTAHSCAPGGTSLQVSDHVQPRHVVPPASRALIGREQVWSLAPAHLKERVCLLITTCKDSAMVLLILIYIVFISSQWQARINTQNSICWLIVRSNAIKK